MGFQLSNADDFSWRDGTPRARQVVSHVTTLRQPASKVKDSGKAGIGALLVDPVPNGDDMRPEYDFSNAVRGKYYERYRQGTNVVLLDPDVAEVFPNLTAVNDALRALVAVG